MVKNTPISLILFGSSTAGIQTAVMNKKLNAADPTIVAGPNSSYGESGFYTAARTFRKISGAEDPRAISERFAIVAFQTGTSTKNFFFPVLSQTSILSVVEVITSIASMNLSAIIEIPMNK